MEDAFRSAVEHIFSNWTALRLAVEHGMGGPESQKTAVECMAYITQFCLYEQDVDADKICEALDDILDEEFDTICEDGSTKEVAVVLDKFAKLIKNGEMVSFQEEFSKLPAAQPGWIVQSSTITTLKPVSNNSAVCNRTNVPMEEDSEWTEVKSKRHR